MKADKTKIQKDLDIVKGIVTKIFTDQLDRMKVLYKETSGSMEMSLPSPVTIKNIQQSLEKLLPIVNSRGTLSGAERNSFARVLQVLDQYSKK